MNIKIMYNNDRIDQVDSEQLEKMISMKLIKMFMRSDGWAIAGTARVRGKGGMYEGPDRRGLYGLTDELKYKIFT